ncbi:Ig-like domain-containing protein [Levilactobacillus enshiensis]|uniref:Ig-like domain-containing protein n=1 Tax=Levilactobacillus enshiensis TaxID=2590213 RepID=UPI001CDCBB17|nr:Ig-like domain-containing protein [Levilactobacillus enshiensis]
MGQTGAIPQPLVRRRVTPSEVAVTGVTLDQSKISIEIGKTAALVATVLPVDATNKSVNFTSSDDTIATVTADGTVTAIKAGDATITATVGDKTATADITVTEAA